MQIATLNFGRKHYQNGQANAFRHALWNVLIAQKCMSVFSRTVYSAIASANAESR